MAAAMILDTDGMPPPLIFRALDLPKISPKIMMPQSSFRWDAPLKSCFRDLTTVASSKDKIDYCHSYPTRSYLKSTSLQLNETTDNLFIKQKAYKMGETSAKELVSPDFQRPMCRGGFRSSTYRTEKKNLMGRGVPNPNTHRPVNCSLECRGRAISLNVRYCNKADCCSSTARVVATKNTYSKDRRTVELEPSNHTRDEVSEPRNGMNTSS